MFSHLRINLQLICLSLLIATLVFPVSSLGVGITSASYCVHGGGFEFAVELADVVAGINVFRIGADSGPFSGNTERFDLNFDGTTGAISAGPEINTFGSPLNDRWLDGAVTICTLTDLGGGAWRLEGTLQHGANPFAEGDEVRDTLIREGGSPDVSLLDTPIGTCVGISPEIASIDYCVDGNVFVFEVDLLNLDPGTVMFRIAADDVNFTSTNERFRVNFDAATGSITAAAEIQTFETPSHDRWLDGAVTDFNLISLGVNAWRVKGRVEPGAEPFTDGDSVRQTTLRSSAHADLSSDNDPVEECTVPADPNTWGGVKNLYR